MSFQTPMLFISEERHGDIQPLVPGIPPPRYHCGSARRAGSSA